MVSSPGGDSTRPLSPTPMPEIPDELFSIAFFPYLKTSGPVRFGPYLFRSTDDLEGLNKAQVTAVAEVTAMLYTQNNARVRSATYALMPPVHVPVYSKSLRR